MIRKAITLASSVEWFGQPVSAVYLRPPRSSHLFRFGDPRFLVMQDGGASYWCDRDDVIARYIEELLSLDGEKTVDGGAGAFVGLLSLQDGIALRDALFDFFTDARLANSKKKLTA